MPVRADMTVEDVEADVLRWNSVLSGRDIELQEIDMRFFKGLFNISCATLKKVVWYFEEGDAVF